jgi:hypothetical protein
MYLGSLLAVRAAIEAAVPDINTFYIESLPASLSLPAFYLEHMESGTEFLGVNTVQFTVQWQVMYFPPLQADGSPDALNLLAVTDKLREAFHADRGLTSPDGTLFQLEEFTGGTREAGMYIAIKLRTQYNRTSEEPEYDRVQSVHVSGLQN